MMAFDAFISYANNDKATADATCAALESAGIRCWIAPRDIAPGSDWGAAIIEALESCRLFVLIFSSSADTSPQVRNEIVKAASRGVVIVPIRIEDTIPTKSLAYYMGGVHWLDALTPPLERHLHVLVATVTALLKLDPTKTDAPGYAHQASQASYLACRRVRLDCHGRTLAVPRPRHLCAQFRRRPDRRFVFDHSASHPRDRRQDRRNHSLRQTNDLHWRKRRG
jgi:hypothetical protein